MPCFVLSLLYLIAYIAHVGIDSAGRSVKCQKSMRFSEQTRIK